MRLVYVKEKWACTCPETQRTNNPLQKADDFTCYIFQKNFFLVTSSEKSNSSNRMELRKLFIYNYIKRLICFSEVLKMSLKHQCETEICDLA